MSYCHKSDESNVQLHESVIGGSITCHECELQKDWQSVEGMTPHAALTHLQMHLQHGHKVPQHALDRLTQELQPIVLSAVAEADDGVRQQLRAMPVEALLGYVRVSDYELSRSDDPTHHIAFRLHAMFEEITQQLVTPTLPVHDERWSGEPPARAITDADLKAAYLAGFDRSCEGSNGEYGPTDDVVGEWFVEWQEGRSG